jgi:hypothetical protein
MSLIWGDFLMNKKLKYLMGCLAIAIASVVGLAFGGHAQAAANNTQPAYDHYLFVYFKSLKYRPNDQQLYFAVSQDGLHFTELNHGQPAIPMPDFAIRDPYIMRRQDNQGFDIVATAQDYQNRENWSRSILVMDSPDLLGWGYHMSTISSPYVGCTWAPEMTWDPDTGKYMIYWAQTIPDDNYSKLGIWTSQTSDLDTYTTPTPYFTSDSSSLTDLTLFQQNDHYIRFTKNETDKHVYEDIVPNLSDVNSTPINTPLLNQMAYVEGPEMYKLYNKNEWVLMLDHYEADGYEPVVSSDPSSGNFTKLNPSDYSIPDGARHGSILPISNDEYNRLVNRFPA